MERSSSAFDSQVRPPGKKKKARNKCRLRACFCAKAWVSFFVYMYCPRFNNTWKTATQSGGEQSKVSCKNHCAIICCCCASLPCLGKQWSARGEGTRFFWRWTPPRAAASVAIARAGLLLHGEDAVCEGRFLVFCSAGLRNHLKSKECGSWVHLRATSTEAGPFRAG